MKKNDKEWKRSIQSSVFHISLSLTCHPYEITTSSSLPAACLHPSIASLLVEGQLLVNQLMKPHRGSGLRLQSSTARTATELLLLLLACGESLVPLVNSQSALQQRQQPKLFRHRHCRATCSNLMKLQRFTLLHGFTMLHNEPIGIWTVHPFAVREAPWIWCFPASRKQSVVQL